MFFVKYLNLTEFENVFGLKLNIEFNSNLLKSIANKISIFHVQPNSFRPNKPCSPVHFPFYFSFYFSKPSPSAHRPARFLARQQPTALSSTFSRRRRPRLTHAATTVPCIPSSLARAITLTLLPLHLPAPAPLLFSL
jgi:hypothetical protein